jgi:hypothetical protein
MAMNKALALLAAATFALLSASALADDKTSANVTPADQAKMKQEAAAKKAAAANMTKEQKAAAKKAANAKKQKDETTMEKVGNPNATAKGDAISKSAADSKASPAPAKGTMNTPEAEKALKQQKGQ